MEWVNVVTILGAIGGVLAFLGTVLLALITFRSNRLVESFKGEQAEQIEHLRADLRAQAFRSEARFARLHERRLDALADLYVKTVAAESASEMLRTSKNFDYSGVTSGQVRQALLDLSDSVRKNRVWLDESLSTELSTFEDALTGAWMTLDELSSRGEASTEAERKALLEQVWPKVQAKIPTAKAAIEQRLRHALGVLDTEARPPRAISPGAHLPPTPYETGDRSE